MLIIFLVFNSSLITYSKAVAAHAEYDIQPAGSIRISERLFDISAGSVIGIIVFNMLAYPIKSAPFNIGVLATATQANSALVSPFAAAIIGGATAFTVYYFYKMGTISRSWP
ncbi:hypothetical protein TI03_02775 [Achromatium sp. WMS1]|nr:hypothetical protein TI03_02775 [Achromatium sp. WMS1]